MQNITIMFNNNTTHNKKLEMSRTNELFPSGVGKCNIRFKPIINPSRTINPKVVSISLILVLNVVYNVSVILFFLSSLI